MPRPPSFSRVESPQPQARVRRPLLLLETKPGDFAPGPGDTPPPPRPQGPVPSISDLSRAAPETLFSRFAVSAPVLGSASRDLEASVPCPTLFVLNSALLHARSATPPHPGLG